IGKRKSLVLVWCPTCSSVVTAGDPFPEWWEQGELFGKNQWAQNLLDWLIPCEVPWHRGKNGEPCRREPKPYPGWYSFGDYRCSGLGRLAFLPWFNKHRGAIEAAARAGEEWDLSDFPEESAPAQTPTPAPASVTL